LAELYTLPLHDALPIFPCKTGRNEGRPARGPAGWESRVSESDSFIDEVTEEVRRDKLFAVFRKYGWIGVLAVLLIVGGAAWSEWQKVRARTAAEGFGDAVVAAMDTEDPAARVEI